MKTIDVDYCVIGAGYAGLTAAYRLTQAGHKVAVLEARNRIGGRVWSEHLADGTPVDLGGTFIGPDHKNLVALMKELGVETIDTFCKGDNQLVYNGKLYRYKGLIPDLDIFSLASMGVSIKLLNEMSKEVPPEAPWNAPKAKEWDATTVEQWINNPVHSFTDAARIMLHALMRGIFTCEASELSLLNLLWFLSTAGNDMEITMKVENGDQQWMCAGGMMTPATKLAEKLGASIHLQSPVRKISQNDSGVEVQSDTITVKAKRAILCVPPVVADRIDFEPALPTTRAQLIRRMPAGNCIKFVAIYDEPFWRKDGLNGQTAAIDQAISMTLDTSPPSGKPGSMTSFAFGKAAVELAEKSPEERKKVLLESYAQYYGPKALSPLHYFEVDWSAEQWTRGCHMAHYPTGILTNFGRALREPTGRIHWATTETSPAWVGNIDGAVGQGERVAQEVMAAKETVKAR